MSSFLPGECDQGLESNGYIYSEVFMRDETNTKENKKKKFLECQEEKVSIQ